MAEGNINSSAEEQMTVTDPASLVEVLQVLRVRLHPGQTFSVLADVDFSGTIQRLEVGVNATDRHPVVTALREWLAANPQAPVESQPTPSDEQRRAAMPDLTARQLRLGLLDAGIAPWQVQQVIEDLPAGTQREKALVEWEFASSFSRVHPLISFVGARLNLSDERIDFMWTAATTL